MRFLRPDARAVFFVAHETSTSQRNHPEMLAPLFRVRCPNALLVADVVRLALANSSDPNALGTDVLVVSSTKAMMAPPGSGLAARTAVS